jgi:hypothetical protein
MARQSAAYRTTGAGSTTLPMASLYSLGTGDLWLVEVIITNTTATSACIGLRRLTTAGTAPAAAAAQNVQYEEGLTNFTAKGDPRDTHTVGPTITNGNVRAADTGASIGSGMAFTFGGRGLFIPSGTANGVGLIPITGTGQICTVSWSWDA